MKKLLMILVCVGVTMGVVWGLYNVTSRIVGCGPEIDRPQKEPDCYWRVYQINIVRPQSPDGGFAGPPGWATVMDLLNMKLKELDPGCEPFAITEELRTEKLLRMRMGARDIGIGKSKAWLWIRCKVCEQDNNLLTIGVGKIEEICPKCKSFNSLCPDWGDKPRQYKYKCKDCKHKWGGKSSTE